MGTHDNEYVHYYFANIFQGRIKYELLEYNMIFITIQKTGRKPCCIREQIIGIAMADFDNVTCV